MNLTAGASGFVRPQIAHTAKYTNKRKRYILNLKKALRVCAGPRRWAKNLVQRTTFAIQAEADLICFGPNAFANLLVVRGGGVLAVRLDLFGVERRPAADAEKAEASRDFRVLHREVQDGRAAAHPHSIDRHFRHSLFSCVRASLTVRTAICFV